MKSAFVVLASAASILATPAFAESPPLAHQARPGTTFTDALNAFDLAIESTLNTALDGVPAKAGAPRKPDVKDKAFGTLFGTIRNNQGSQLCGLVLANGQFMFSCSPTGSYSLDTVTDASGLVTLFGFVDGHMPYKQVLTGFGRWDMTLNIATGNPPPPPPPPPPVSETTVTFNITDGCNNGVQIDYKFYDQTNNLVWPSATSHYFTSAFNATYTHNLLCRTNAKICYGARSAGFYWGIDVDGTKSCSDCCILCETNATLSRRLTC
jgi:hypothetical protein